MSRIRTIKPEFPQSEDIGKLSRDARLLFVQLWTIVDDEGRARAASRMLASLLYPYDDDAKDLMESWLIELEEHALIMRYEVEGGAYLEISKWLKHQKIDHPSKSKLPGPLEGQREIREPSTRLAPDLGPRTSTKDRDQSSSLRSEDSPKRVRATVNYSDQFNEFWSGYPTDPNMPKKKAWEIWQKLPPEDRDLAIKSLPAFRAYCQKNKDYRPLYADRYLSQARFRGHAETQAKLAIPVVTGVFVKIDTPQWNAWRDFKIKTTGRPVNPVNGGWYFPTEWPPDFVEISHEHAA